MYTVILVYFSFLVFTRGEMQQVKLPIYTPPSPEEILNTYFHNWNESATNRTKKSILNVSDKYYKTLETMKKELSANLTNLETNSNLTDEGSTSKNKENFIGTELLKNILTASIEPTTYRYPTAVWSSHTYEKLKNNQKFRHRNLTKSDNARPTLNPLYVYLGRDNNLNGSENTQKKNRGKIKWMDIIKSRKDNVHDAKKSDREFVDKFLEQSLAKYLVSSNLKQSVGNVSVETFSEILKNITDNKPKKLQSPYDENKELRMRFREEVILKKKNETKPQEKFLQKQLQKRLEKAQDVFGEMSKEKILTNMWKYMTLNRSAELSSEKTKNKTIGYVLTNITTSTTREPETNFLTVTSTKNYNDGTTKESPETNFLSVTSTKNHYDGATREPETNFLTVTSTKNYNDGTTRESPETNFFSTTSTKYYNEVTTREHETNSPTMTSPQNYNDSLIYITTYKPKYEINNYQYYNGEAINDTKTKSDYGIETFEESKKREKNLLKLTAEESSYYNSRRQFPTLTFIGKQEKPGLIPGTPQIDYPTHSFPPATRFKCPKFKDGKPRMMADKSTRCQVFYICTGDGPTTAMLCPNGTMFNENFLVCDWWYNVHC